MSKFDHLKALDVAGSATTRYTLHEITVNGKCPTLIGRPATEANKPYFNSLLKKARKNVRAAQAGAVNAAMLEENRDEDRRLFHEHVITGWENMVDVDGGADLPFNKKDCKDFLAALPNHIFDKVRDHFATTENFVDGIDIDTTAKN